MFLKHNREAARAKAVSDAIDCQLMEDSINLKSQLRVLLLGSDQSSLVRNVKLMQGGLSNEELTSRRLTVYQNTLYSAQTLIRDMCYMGVDWIRPANSENADRVLDYRVEDVPSFVFSTEIAQVIHGLLQDPVIPSVMERRSAESLLRDDANYLLENILRIGSPDYHPTEDDVFRAREKKHGLQEIDFAMDQLRVTIVDTNGMRSEWKKCIHYFQDVTTILFCARLSDYDCDLGSRGLTALHESLILFESVINSRWFLRTSIVLFLTDVESFKNKLPKVPLERYFPEYTGGADVNKAARYILWRFMQVNRARLSVYPHLANLTDVSCSRLLLAAVKETILQNSFRDALGLR